jgi:hypothetical protein
MLDWLQGKKTFILAGCAVGWAALCVFAGDKMTAQFGLTVEQKGAVLLGLMAAAQITTRAGQQADHADMKDHVSTTAEK